MKLTVESAHALRTRDGKSRCIKCRNVDPDLTEPCPKSGLPVEPADTEKKKK